MTPEELNDLEGRLRSRLHRLAAEARTTPTRPLGTGTPATAGRPTPLVAIGAAAAVAAIGISAMVILANRDSDGDDTTSPTPTSITTPAGGGSMPSPTSITTPAGGGSAPPTTTAPATEWSGVTGAPLRARSNALGVWTGEEVLVIGGEPEPGCPPSASCIVPDHPPLSDGAAYNPRADSWRQIADAPTGVVSGSTAVLDGDVYVATFGHPGRPGMESGLLRYRTDEDIWERLPDPPEGDLEWRSLLAVAGRVVAFAGSDEPISSDSGPGTTIDWRQDADRADFVFDPSTNAWGELPPDPLSPAFDRVMVALGDRLMLFNKQLVPNPGAGRNPSLVRAARFDFATQTWTRLDDSEILSPGPWLGEGDVLVNPRAGGADGGNNEWGRTVPYGGIYDSARDRWLPLPDPPPEGSDAGALGSETALYWRDQGAVFDVATNTWITLPDLPEPRDDVYGATVVAAGADLFVFGGEDWSDPGEARVIDDAFLWRSGRS